MRFLVLPTLYATLRQREESLLPHRSFGVEPDGDLGPLPEVHMLNASRLQAAPAASSPRPEPPPPRAAPAAVLLAQATQAAAHQAKAALAEIDQVLTVAATGPGRAARSDGPQKRKQPQPFAARWGASLAQLETRASHTAHELATSTAQGFVGKIGGYICGALLAMAACSWLYNKLCGEKSCWFTWPLCRKLRLMFKLDKHPELTFKIAVHKARDLGHGSCFIAILPRRGKGKAKKQKPKLVDKKKGEGSVVTAMSSDGSWEQNLTVVVPQGCDVLQVCAFKHSLLGKASLLGWDELEVDELAGIEGDSFTHKWVFLQSEQGAPAGSVDVSIQPPERPKKKAGKHAKNELSPEEKWAQMTDEEKLKDLGRQLSGPLNQVDKLGEYKLRWFQAEQKHDIWVFAWYDGKEAPKAGAKPLGRVPILSITTVYEVPNSISEFIVRFRDPKDRGVDMMLMRHKAEQSREWWVKTLHKMLEQLREARKNEQKAVQEAMATHGAHSGHSGHSGHSAGSGRSSDEKPHGHAHKPKKSVARKSHKKAPGSSGDDSSGGDDDDDIL